MRASILRGVTFCDTVLEAVRDADAAVVVTGWDELRDLPRAEIRDAMRVPLIVDGRNVVDPEAARAAGFTYEGIGRAGDVSLGGLPETDEPAIRVADRRAHSRPKKSGCERRCSSARSRSFGVFTVSHSPVVGPRPQPPLGGELREGRPLVVAALRQPGDGLLVQDVHAHVDPVR